MDFIIRKGIKKKSFFILPHGMLHRYSSLKKDIRESEAFLIVINLITIKDSCIFARHE